MPKLTMEAARVNAGMTQNDIADKMGISRAYYSNIETGKIEAKPVYIYAFCQITGISMDNLILPEKSTKRILAEE